MTGRSHLVGWKRAIQDHSKGDYAERQQEN
jgi:hypothetical protein